MSKPSILILVALLSMICGSAWAAGTAGFVAAAKGEAQVVRGGQPQAALLGMAVEVGDLLKTGAKARLKVLLSDDSVLSLGSNSEVKVTEHLYDATGGQRVTRLDLVSGMLRALVQKSVGEQRANFEIQTHNAVAGVRGTVMYVNAEDAKKPSKADVTAKEWEHLGTAFVRKGKRVTSKRMGAKANPPNHPDARGKELLALMPR